MQRPSELSHCSDTHVRTQGSSPAALLLIQFPGIGTQGDWKAGSSTSPSAPLAGNPDELLVPGSCQHSESKPAYTKLSLSLSLFRSLSLCCSAFHADKKHFFPQWKRIGTTKVLIIFTVSRCWAGKGKMNRKLLIFNFSATCLLNATNMGSPYSSWKYVSVTLHHSS